MHTTTEGAPCFTQAWDSHGGSCLKVQCTLGDVVLCVPVCVLQALMPCPHCTLKLVSSVSGMGSMCPHYIQFHPKGFHPVSSQWVPSSFIPMGSIQFHPNGFHPISPQWVPPSFTPMGSTQFHPNGFQPVSPETFRRVGFNQLRFIEHTCDFIADVPY